MPDSKLLHRILKFINYANLFKINEKCYFSVISRPILILFVLSDRAWCGLQNFYTEFWNSLIMQIYANLFKINEKCHLQRCQPVRFYRISYDNRAKYDNTILPIKIRFSPMSVFRSLSLFFFLISYQTITLVWHFISLLSSGETLPK